MRVHFLLLIMPMRASLQGEGGPLQEDVGDLVLFNGSEDGSAIAVDEGMGDMPPQEVSRNDKLERSKASTEQVCPSHHVPPFGVYALPGACCCICTVVRELRSMVPF
jgi:hypothetical protein